jgi:hypothetical protein
MEGQTLERRLPPNRSANLESQTCGPAPILSDRGVPVDSEDLPKRSAEDSTEVIEAAIALTELSVQSCPGNEGAMTGRNTA